jgi:transposase
LSEDEQDRVDSLSDEGDALIRELETELEDGTPEAEAASVRLADIERELDAIEAARTMVDDAVKDQLGTFIYLALTAPAGAQPHVQRARHSSGGRGRRTRGAVRQGRDLPAQRDAGRRTRDAAAADRRATRRHFSAEDKIRIVLEGLRGEESIAELCRREGIAQSVYYSWSKEFLEAGKRRLAGDTARAATSDEVKDLRRETLALKECVADLTLENRLLKKV